MPRELWGEFIDDENISNEERKIIPLGAKRIKLTEIQTRKPQEEQKK